MMHFKKLLKLQSVINISDMVVSDINGGHKVQAFDIMNLNTLLSFKDSREMNKAFFANDVYMLKVQLLDINKKAKKDLRTFLIR